MSENLASGFWASNVYPVDRYQVLKYLPNLIMSDELDKPVFNESVPQILNENCGVKIEKKRVQTETGQIITPGKRITSLSDDKNDAPGPSKNEKILRKKDWEQKYLAVRELCRWMGLRWWWPMDSLWCVQSTVSSGV